MSHGARDRYSCCTSSAGTVTNHHSSASLTGRTTPPVTQPSCCRAAVDYRPALPEPAEPIPMAYARHPSSRLIGGRPSRVAISDSALPAEHTAAFSPSYAHSTLAADTAPALTCPLQMPTGYVSEGLTFDDAVEFPALNWELAATLSPEHTSFPAYPQQEDVLLPLNTHYGPPQFTTMSSGEAFLPHLLDPLPEFDPTEPRTFPALDFSNLRQPIGGFPPAVYQLDQSHQGTYTYQSPAVDPPLLGGISQHTNIIPTTNQELNIRDLSGLVQCFNSPVEPASPSAELSIKDADLHISPHPEQEQNETPQSPEVVPLDRDLPYAKLLHRCLMSVPDHTMVLKDIYEWFRYNTDKGKDPNQRGWQNSIRHNLSMNKAFTKVDQPQGPDGKRGYKWKLEDRAIREGIKSTTRYRTKLPSKRGSRSLHPDARRQASGAKGGQATRKEAERQRRSERFREPSLPSQLLFNGLDEPGYTHMLGGETGYIIPGEPNDIGMLYHSETVMPYPASQMEYAGHSDSSRHSTPNSIQFPAYFDENVLRRDPQSELELKHLIELGYIPSGNSSESGHDGSFTPSSNAHSDLLGHESPFCDF